jgi:hypothetical protein
MHPHSHFTTLLLTFTALFSMVNPFSGAFIFFGATRDCVAPTAGPTDRSFAARRSGYSSI